MTTQDALYEWLRDRPSWQQELARRLLTQTELTPAGLEEIVALVMEAAEGRPAATSPPLRREEFPAASRDPAPRLTSVSDLVGVAAAAPDERIEIEADGLTIVYGANGAGKSTYVRVLKRVLRSVDRDDVVRGDVYADSVSEDAEAAATFTLLRNSETAEHRVDLHEPQDLGLETISVFDTGSAELYLGASNEIAYVPMAVRLLARMATTQDELRSQLDAQRTAEAQKRPDFSSVPAPSEAARRIEELGGSTDIDELIAFASLNDQEQRRHNELRAALASARTQDVRADAESAAQDAGDAATIRRSLNDLVNALSVESLAELRAKAQETRVAKEAVAEAASAIQGMAEGVGGETWQRMWAAARDFAKPHGHPFPPSEGEVCMLCLQTVDASTSSRMDLLEDYVTSELQRQADQTDESPGRIEVCGSCSSGGSSPRRISFIA